MMARLTRTVLGLHLLSMVAIAALMLALGLVQSALIAFMISAGLLTLMRMAIVFNNFLLSAALSVETQNGERGSIFAITHMVLQEWRTSTVCWFWALPFGGFRQRQVAGDAALPVLLIHGYAANSGFWQSTSKALTRAGISHWAIDLEPLLTDIDTYAVRIAETMKEICRLSGHTQVILLAHSMGGLAARAYLRQSGSAQIARIITLGTPHFGTTLARYGKGINAAQMQWVPAESAQAKASWLHQLAQGETAADRSCITSVYSRHDNIVSPQDSSILPGAHHIVFDLVGHVALGFDARVQKRVIEEIIAVRQSKL